MKIRYIFHELKSFYTGKLTELHNCKYVVCRSKHIHECGCLCPRYSVKDNGDPDYRAQDK